MSKVLKDLPRCNQACLDHAVKVCKEDRRMVAEIAGHLFHFTAHQLQNKTADSIQLPFFGRFKVKSFKSKTKQDAKLI
jgi:hypothetical protein